MLLRLYIGRVTQKQVIQFHWNVCLHGRARSLEGSAVCNSAATFGVAFFRGCHVRPSTMGDTSIGPGECSPCACKLEHPSVASVRIFARNLNGSHVCIPYAIELHGEWTNRGFRWALTLPRSSDTFPTSRSRFPQASARVPALAFPAASIHMCMDTCPRPPTTTNSPNPPSTSTTVTVWTVVARLSPRGEGG